MKRVPNVQLLYLINSSVTAFAPAGPLYLGCQPEAGGEERLRERGRSRCSHLPYGAALAQACVPAAPARAKACREGD